MSRSPRRPPAEPAAAPGGPTVPGLPLVVLATLAVLVTAADTYVVVLALPDILAGVGVGLDDLQRATPIVGGFLLGYTATLPLLGRLADLRGRVPVLVGCLLLFALGLAAHRDGGLARPGRSRPGAAGDRRRRAGSGDPRAGGRPLAPGAPVAPARRRGRGAGGRARSSARSPGRRCSPSPTGGPSSGSTCSSDSGWPAGAVATGRVRRPDPLGLVLAAVAVTALGLQLAAPAALAEDVTLGLLYVPLVEPLDWTTPLLLLAGVGGGGARRPQPRAAGRRRPPAARPAAAGRGDRRARLGTGRRGARQPRVGLRRRRPGHADRRARPGPGAAGPRGRGRVRLARAPHARAGPAAPRAAADRRLGCPAGQPPRRRRPGGGPGRHPAVRPQHDDARGPVRRGAGPAAAADRRAGGRGGRRLAVPQRWRPGSSPPAGWP